MRKTVKRGLAAFLAAILMIPAQPVVAAEQLSSRPVPEMGENTQTVAASSSNATERIVHSSSNAKKKMDFVAYNTGNFEVCVAWEEDVEQLSESVTMDLFDEDGNYTIHIAEPNPFFPYEVQFTYDGKTENHWFMTPEDSVTVGGHTFYVDAYFDGTVVTQMSLNVGGDTVVVYPEEKDFTNDGGIMLLSLLPLEERYLTVDLTAYTPAELTMVSVGSIFIGENELTETDKVLWRYRWNSDADYTISPADGYLNLSYSTYNDTTTNWEMIVGDADQLAVDNIRYLIDAKVTKSDKWLIPYVSLLGQDGSITPATVTEDSEYTDYTSNEWRLRTYIPLSERNEIENFSGYLFRFQLNAELFSNPVFSDLEVYLCRTNDFESLQNPSFVKQNGEDVTELVLGGPETGLAYSETLNGYVVIITYDEDGKETGCLPIKLSLGLMGNSVSPSGLYTMESGRKKSVWSSWRSEITELRNHTYTLYYGYAADASYYLNLSYTQAGISSPALVTAAYEGLYSSISQAEDSGAADIKETLFGNGDGYAANYSNGVNFTVFVGEDNSEGQEVYQLCVRTKEGIRTLSDSTRVYFYGLRDAEGNAVNSYEVDGDLDDYAEYNYLTIFVKEDTDLSKLAPIFSLPIEAQMYAAGSNTPEVSGESFHDFSNGPVQYTVSAENGIDSKNYWLHVVKAEEGNGKIYINSLSDEASETREEDGVVYSTREMFLDVRYDYQHDILIANIGMEAIDSLTVELVSDQVELDDYWTLNGKYSLGGLTTVSSTTSYGELPNMALIRLLPKIGIENSEEISGTLILKSGDMVLMVLNLTGVVGDPGIVTQEVPDGVKYVPYGTMIQNSNKYDWNTVSYSISDGELPDGMELKANGELYGVPMETGEFTITVEMENSYEEFGTSERTFTFEITENTDENVNAATDEGYFLTQRIQDLTLSSTNDQTLISSGVYDQFVDIFLDGVKLAEGIDYDSESGSTRITIRSQTLKASNTTGTHTLGIEFRTPETNTLKRAAQNYRVTGTASDTGSSSSSSGEKSSSSSSSRAVQTTMIVEDEKKGHIHALTGIVTGTGQGYSRWMKDEKGWWFLYADGTYAAGTMAEQNDGSRIEQILWEQINGSWYAFGADGYLKSGWVYDYQSNSWYCTTEENGMQSGWYTDPQDQYTYYLDPENGKLVFGWKEIENRWYYFNDVLAPRTWEFDESTGKWYYNVLSTTKPFGALFKDEKTPDGYYVNDDGEWFQ